MPKNRLYHNRKSRLTKWIVGLCVVAGVLLTLAGFRVYSYYRYSPEQPLTLEKCDKAGDTLRVAILGDSWAAYHSDADSTLQLLFVQQGMPVNVISKGNVGAKSKEIYQRMFNTSKCVLEQHPDYCVLSAGINDAVAKMSPKFYTYHYLLIIRLLLDADIKPVVLDMPDVNYQAISHREHWLKRTRHRLSALMNGTDMYSFNSYRKALLDALTETGLMDSVVYIPAQTWNGEGYRDTRHLYKADETHLSQNGYHVLDSCICSEILKDLSIKQ